MDVQVVGQEMGSPQFTDGDERTTMNATMTKAT